MEYVRLNNGIEMPEPGFGTFRLIDTAEDYGNEAAVGEGRVVADDQIECL